MIKIGKFSIVSILVASFYFLGIPTSAADELPATERVDLVESIKRIENGTWNQEDIDLIEDYPEISRNVPDPTNVEAFVSNPQIERIESTGVGFSSQDETWRVSRRVGIRGYTILGSTAYVWRNTVEWVFTPDSGESLEPTNETSWSEVDPFMVITPDPISNSTTEIQSNSPQIWRVERMDHINNEIPVVGGWVNRYPEVHMEVDGEGYYSFSAMVNGDLVYNGGGYVFD